MEITSKEMLVTIVFINSLQLIEANRFANQLYEDLLYYYNKNVRPVKNSSNAVQVKFGASLIRIIDVVRCSANRIPLISQKYMTV
ncbi:hypothetical protein AB6A40_011518 [Gnathostoma spinigerum]|uniref:Neurotransmitter-gated ion-channel ligand-binding domain-containing protein n=1 Tax=Gnathostoma spinigerum TaxID=75299 RepID=A0ABD6EXV3_9BILA